MTPSWCCFYWKILISPWGLPFQGSTPRIYERTRSWLGLWCRTPPLLHLHDGCLYQCRAPSGGTWGKTGHRQGWKKQSNMAESGLWKHWLMILLEQLQDGQHNIIHVTEAWSFRLLGVVESSGPVDCDVRLLPVQLHWPSYTKHKELN